MKKSYMSLFLVLSLSFSAFAGGIQTNTNQSARYTRSLVRDASLCIDGVYFNPAGLTTLGEGFHFSLNNQSIFQNKTVSCNYQYLHSPDYDGKVEAMLFPGVYAAYIKGNFVFSFGLNPVGGGGGATFEKGLPSFERNVADLVPGLNAAGAPVTDYQVDAFFEGTSVYWGGQLGVSYKINDMISVFAGGRYISGVNTYKGHLKSIQVLNATGNNLWIPAATVFSQAIPQLQQAIDFFTSVGLTDSVAKYSALKQEAEARVALTSDQEADVKQVGTAFTPILGVNLMLLDNKMNIGIKYEFQTDIELENQTTKDIKVGFAADGTPITMFPDGAKSRSDMPALLSIGVGYNVNEKIRASVGYHYYFDKDADYGKKDVAGVYVANDKIIDNNYYEIGLGLEYKLSEKLLVSAGYLRAVTGVNYDLYQTDLSYSLTSATVGGGCAYKINDKFEVNLGCSYTAYENGFKNYIHSMGGMVDVPVIDTYDKDALIFGIGLDIHL